MIDTCRPLRRSSFLSLATLATLATVAPVNAATLPGVPRKVRATVEGSTVIISFSAPRVTGSSRATRYVVIGRDRATSAIATAARKRSPIALKGLPAGHYRLTVHAQNAAGTGLSSSPVYCIVRTAPGPPTGVFASAGAGEAVITFRPPTDDGGSTITGYAVTASGPTAKTVTSIGSPATVTNLAPGPYTFSIRAITAEGSSVESVASEPIAVGAVQGFLSTAVYAVSDAYTLAQMAMWKASGGTHVLLPVYWDRWQTEVGGAAVPSSVEEWRSWVATARAVGLRVITEFNYASSPGFYRDFAPRYQNQAGVSFVDDGDAYRDVVFSATARSLVGGFFSAVFAALTSPTDFDLVDTVRVGGGPVGELNYPSGHTSSPAPQTPSWWCFSQAAQTGADLASGQTPSPVPGAYPFQTTPPGSTATAQDTLLYTWYSDALVNQMRWEIGLLRRGWSGLVHVLHPSFGVRYSRGSGDLNWRFEMAQGADWARQMDAYPDRGVYPWCTWANRAADANPCTEDGQKSPVQYLAELASTRGDLPSGLLGENAAGATDADMTLMWTDPVQGLIPLGYRGVMWVSYDDLTSANPGSASLSALTALMQSCPATGSILTAGP